MKKLEIMTKNELINYVYDLMNTNNYYRYLCNRYERELKKYEQKNKVSK